MVATPSPKAAPDRSTVNSLPQARLSFFGLSGSPQSRKAGSLLRSLSSIGGARYAEGHATHGWPLCKEYGWWRGVYLSSHVVHTSWISADGQLIGYGGEDHKLHVVETATLREVQTLDSPEDVLVSWISQDGQLIGYGGRSKEFRVVDTKTWKELAIFSCAANIRTSWISSDGKLIGYSGADSKLHVVDRTTWKEVKALEALGYVACSCISADGKIIAYGDIAGKLHVRHLLLGGG